MISPACLFMKLMICFLLLCAFIQYSNTQPLLNDDNDEEQTRIYDEILNNYIPRQGQLNIPESLYNYHHRQQLFPQNKHYHPDNQQLAKRIIMLPRVGRRSISSQ